MEDSTSTFNPKDTKKGKKITKKRQCADDLTSEGSNADTLRSMPSRLTTKGKSKWKSFFNLFSKASSERLLKKQSRESSRRDIRERDRESKHILVKDEPCDLYLSDVNDEFAMAISLPDDVKGKDVQVSIELKAIDKQDLQKSKINRGLNVVEETTSKTSFSGNIKIPSNTTIERISRMPLYFISSTKTNHNGHLSNKVETVIKPLENNLPSSVSKHLIISDINLKVCLQNVKDRKMKRVTSLNYDFISNEPTKVEHHTGVEKCQEVLNENSESTEESKTVVKEILSRVLTKIQTNEASTQSTNMIRTMNREVDVQRSLVLRKNAAEMEAHMARKEYLTRISERDETETHYTGDYETSEESFYPKSTTSFSLHDTTTVHSDTDSSMLTLNMKTKMQKSHKPRFVIKYDNPKQSFQRYDSSPYNPSKKSEESQVHYISLEANSTKYSPKQKCQPNNYPPISEDVRADIDQTLNLLETAKSKLLGYLHSPIGFHDMGLDGKYPPGYLVETDLPINNYTGCIQELNRNDRQLFEAKNLVDQRLKVNYPLAKTKTLSAEIDKKFFLGKTKNETPSKLIAFLDMGKDAKQSTALTTIINISELKKSITVNTLQFIKSKPSSEKLDTETCNSKQKEVAYNIIENDINTMIRDLLNESHNIRELAIQCLEQKEREVTSSEDDVRSLLQSVFEETMNIVESTKTSPKFSAPPLCVNYCLINKEFQSQSFSAPEKCVTSKTIFPNTSNSKVLKTSWNFGASRCTSPTVSIKRIPRSKEINIFNNNYNFLNVLDKETAFLKEVCSEIYSVNSKTPRNVSASLSENGNSKNIYHRLKNMSAKSDSKSSSIEKTKSCNAYLTQIIKNANSDAPPNLLSVTDPVSSLISCELALIDADSEHSASSNNSNCTRNVYTGSYSKNKPNQLPTTAYFEDCDENNSNLTVTSTINSNSYSVNSSAKTSILETNHKGSKMDLPMIKYIYNSALELNNHEEIVYIEENVKRNLTLNPERTEEMSKGKRPFIFKPQESIILRNSFDSDASFESSSQ